jgi:hypothetical protein
MINKVTYIFFIVILFASCSKSQFTILKKYYDHDNIKNFNIVLLEFDKIISQRFPSNSVDESYNMFLDSLELNLNRNHKLIELLNTENVEEIFSKTEFKFVDGIFNGSAIRRPNQELSNNYRQVRINISTKYTAFISNLVEINPNLKDYSLRLFELDDPSSEMGMISLANAKLSLYPEERLVVALEYIVLCSYYFEIKSYPLLD